MRFRSFLDRNHHSEFSNKFVPPFGVAHTYIAYIEEYPSPPPPGWGAKYFTHEKSHYPVPQTSMTVMSDLHKWMNTTLTRKTTALKLRTTT